MNTPFKMKGFGGFGNSPTKLDNKPEEMGGNKAADTKRKNKTVNTTPKKKKFKSDDVFYTKPNTMEGTTKRTVRQYEYMKNPKTGKYGYKFSTGEFINEDDIEN